MIDPDVFVSHSTRNKAVADAVTTYLEAAGHRCWIAPRDIAPGRSYGEAILDGIYSTRAFVLVFSGEANQSRHVLKEVERAINADKVVVPFRIESVMPSGAMEYFLSTDQWLDALTRPLDPHLAALERTVAGILGRTATAGAPPPRDTLAEQAAEMQELAPDEWVRRRGSWMRRVHDALFGDHD